MPFRSPDSSSCSSRDPSPCSRPPPTHAPVIRRQSTTEEILIARGFRRQSTTEEMIRCRNFRRQSSQSDDQVLRVYVPMAVAFRKTTRLFTTYTQYSMAYLICIFYIWSIIFAQLYFFVKVSFTCRFNFFFRMALENIQICLVLEFTMINTNDLYCICITLSSNSLRFWILLYYAKDFKYFYDFSNFYQNINVVL